MTAPTPGPDAVARDEVGEGLAKVIERLDWSVTGDAEFDPSSREIADVVLASGLVVPVGEVRTFPDDYGWDDLMALLDRHWPEDVFPTLPDGDLRDAGPRIVSLLRWVDRAEAQVAAVRALADAHRGPRYTIDGATGEHYTYTTVITPEQITAALDAAPASPSTDQRIEARQLSGEHVGRLVVLPDGTRGTLRGEPGTGGSIPVLIGPPMNVHSLAPSDVVTLIGGEE